MSFLYLLSGLLLSAFGVFLTIRRDLQIGKRAVGCILAVIGLIGIVYALKWSPQATVRKFREASDRQGYVSGFGLGEYLKKSQPGKQLAIVRTVPDSSRNRQVVRGLQDGLNGSLTIVAELEIDCSKVETYQEAVTLLSTDRLVELKSSGADIVVSFVGIPIGLVGLVYDADATKQLWRSPEYTALKWVMPYPPEIMAPAYFREGNVLAMVRQKPEAASEPNAKGTPAELFNTWFELVTSD